MTDVTNAAGAMDSNIAPNYRYQADTEQFTVYDRTYLGRELATVNVSMADSHKLIKAIDTIYKKAREAGISHAVAKMENTLEDLY